MKTQKLLAQEIEDLVEEFLCIEAPIDKMKFIIDLGLEGENDESLLGVEEYLVEGCFSKAYLKIEVDDDLNVLELSYYADAVIIQGFFAIICDLLNTTLVSELDESLARIKEFSKEVGLQDFLSPNRANALYNIFNRLEGYTQTI